LKNAANTKKLTALLSRHQKLDPVELPSIDDPVESLVLSFLLWESNAATARSSFERIRGAVVDSNDLRVLMPYELLELIGSDGPYAQERAERIRASLRDVFLREHEVSLRGLGERGKREIRRYLETLDGIVPYVAARVMLVDYQVHAVPVDGRLLGALVEEGVFDEDAALEDVVSWLQRQIKAEEGPQVHQALQAWMETVPLDGGAGTGGSSRAASRSRSSSRSTSRKSGSKSKATTKKAAGKKTTKKKTTKKTTKKKTAKKATTARSGSSGRSSAGRKRTSA